MWSVWDVLWVKTVETFSTTTWVSFFLISLYAWYLPILVQDTAPAAVSLSSIPSLGAIWEPLLLDVSFDVCPSLPVATLQREHEHLHQLLLAVPVAVINSAHCLGGCWLSHELWPILSASSVQDPLRQMPMPAAAMDGSLSLSVA